MGQEIQAHPKRAEKQKMQHILFTYELLNEGAHKGKEGFYILINSVFLLLLI